MRYGSAQTVAVGPPTTRTVVSTSVADGSTGKSTLRSRLPKRSYSNQKQETHTREDQAANVVSGQSLRRKQVHEFSLPLREAYASEGGLSATNDAKLSKKIAKHSNEVPGKETTWRAPEIFQSNSYQQGVDLEKGVADLDGRPKVERSDVTEHPDRLTFLEWKRHNFSSNDTDAAPDSSIHKSRKSVSENDATQKTDGDQEDQKVAASSVAAGSHSMLWEDIPFSEPPHHPLATMSTKESCPYAEIADPIDPSKQLSKMSIRIHRLIALIVVILCNAVPLVAYFRSHRHLWVLIFIVFVKAKDVLSTIISAGVLLYRFMRKRRKTNITAPKNMMSLITVSFETEEQVMKTLESIRDADLGPHKQFLCLILDGPPKNNIQRKIVRTCKGIRRPYVTWMFRRNELDVDCGFLEGIPIIYIQKLRNQGKKDSLILCHDLFNCMRANAPLYTKLLREEIWSSMIPTLIASPFLTHFDAIFCTDADSIIHKDAQRKLIEEIHNDERSIAACGILLAELDYRTEWSIWSLFQQFQYSYGQVVRRQAEGIWGRVTCLPGCITMIAVRPEMAKAIQDYAQPVTDKTFWRHQVQYLGTDRRLTYSMLAQGTKLKTLFVPDALSETVCPQSLKHYLNQRRRWGSNAYFNDYFYCFGRQQFLITRLWAFIDISRMTFVYYRQANNILFLYGLARNFQIIKIVPLLIVTQTPTVWFLILILTRQPTLRRRLHKLLLGLFLNYLLSPILSILVFSRMILQLGASGITWDSTGICTAKPDPTLRITTPCNSISSSRLPSIIRSTLLSECEEPEDDEACPNRIIPDASRPASYAPSITETLHSARTVPVVVSTRVEKLPSHLRSRSLERHQRPNSKQKGWPLQEVVPPVPKDEGG